VVLSAAAKDGVHAASMHPPVRTVHVVERLLGDRTVLAVEADDRRSFRFGERVVVIDEHGAEHVGIVAWDPEARWVVEIEEGGARRVPW
jgi:hypothetical protein